MDAMARKDNLRSRADTATGISCVAKGKKKFIWNPGFGDVEQDGIAGLRMIVNVGCGRF
jgi:hypothetical protein